MAVELTMDVHPRPYYFPLVSQKRCSELRNLRRDIIYIFFCIRHAHLFHPSSRSKIVLWLQHLGTYQYQYLLVDKGRIDLGYGLNIFHQLWRNVLSTYFQKIYRLLYYNI
jgi:hypothetical protein